MLYILDENDTPIVVGQAEFEAWLEKLREDGHTTTRYGFVQWQDWLYDSLIETDFVGFTNLPCAPLLWRTKATRKQQGDTQCTPLALILSRTSKEAHQHHIACARRAAAPMN